MIFHENCLLADDSHEISCLISSVGSQKLVSRFSHFSEDKKMNNLLGVSYIAESQTGLYLVTSKFTVNGVLNFQ